MLTEVLTLIYDAVGVVEVNAVIAVGENVHIVVHHTRLIEVVKQL